MQFVTSGRLECAWSVLTAVVRLCGFLPACTMNNGTCCAFKTEDKWSPTIQHRWPLPEHWGFNKYLISINFWSLVVMKAFIPVDFMSLFLFGYDCYMGSCPMFHSLRSWNLEEAVDARILLFENLIITSWYLSPLWYLFPSFILSLGPLSALYCRLGLSEGFVKHLMPGCVSHIYLTPRRCYKICKSPGNALLSKVGIWKEA